MIAVTYMDVAAVTMFVAVEAAVCLALIGIRRLRLK